MSKERDNYKYILDELKRIEDCYYSGNANLLDMEEDFYKLHEFTRKCYLTAIEEYKGSPRNHIYFYKAMLLLLNENIEYVRKYKLTLLRGEKGEE